MVARFTASQSVNLLLPGPLQSVQMYLDQPDRIVYALFDADRVQALADDVFRLQMQTLGFFMLQITPTVDLRVWTDAQHILHIQAVDCQLTGVDAFAHHFQLTLTGLLRPAPQGRGRSNPASAATGHADLAVEVVLPAPLSALSGSLLQTTGNRLLNGVLVTIKRRLAKQLKVDYCRWAAAQQPETAQPS